MSKCSLIIQLCMQKLKIILFILHSRSVYVLKSKTFQGILVVSKMALSIFLGISIDLNF